MCDLADEPSNWRATEGLEPFLQRHGIAALTGRADPDGSADRTALAAFTEAVSSVMTRR